MNASFTVFSIVDVLLAMTSKEFLVDDTQFNRFDLFVKELAGLFGFVL